MVAAVKLSVLNPNEFELWKMRIEQYFLMTDYALCKVILNGDSHPLTRSVKGVETPYPPITVEEKLARKNELKARDSYIDLETLSMDDLYNNLKIYEAKVMGTSSTTQNTQNVDFVSSNNNDNTNKAVNTAHGVYAANSKTNASRLQNVDSVSDAVIYSFFASQSNSPHLDNEDLKQIDPDDLEEMDLKWQMEMLTMRARRFIQKTGRNLGAKGTKTIGFDKTKVECYNYHKRGHFARKCRATKHQDNKNRKAPRRTVPVEDTTSNALVSQYDGLGYDWSDQAEDEPTNFTLMAYTYSSSSSAYKAGLESVKARLEVYQKNETVFTDNIKILKLDVMLRDKAITELRQKFEKAKKERADLKLSLEKELHAPKPDLVFADEHVVSESVTSLPADEDLSLINETAQDQEKINDQDMFGVNDLDGDEVVVDASAREKEEQSEKVAKKKGSTAHPVATADVEPKAATTVNAVSKRPKEKGIIMQKPSKTPSLKPIVSSQQPSKSKDKGKAKMVKPERITKQKEEEANIAMIVEWDNTQAMMDADYELAAKLQEEERGELSIEEKSKLFVELISKRKKHFEMLRAEESRRKPPTKAQQTKQMFKDRAVKSSKRPREELESDKSKKQKIDENVQAEVADDDTAELKRCMEIVPEDDDEVTIKAKPIYSKSPTIVDYNIFKEGKKNYFKIIRANGNSQNYLTFRTMFKNFNREDLEVLRSIVKTRFKKIKLVNEMDNQLFQTLKTMFEHHVKDNI
uniref:Uncharacterized protein n=1 Tax=Tanacetum cinerariifolium TaxID=118510 RepID=A0A6L2MJY1_TANCI|nr:hypothetical protein [Tanacetum cinerariifolium]